MRRLLRCRASDGDPEDAINLAIQVVGESRDDALVHMLVEYFMGDVDGAPKVWIDQHIWTKLAHMDI